MTNDTVTLDKLRAAMRLLLEQKRPEPYTEAEIEVLRNPPPLPRWNPIYGKAPTWLYRGKPGA